MLAAKAQALELEGLEPGGQLTLEEGRQHVVTCSAIHAMPGATGLVFTLDDLELPLKHMTSDLNYYCTTEGAVCLLHFDRTMRTRVHLSPQREDNGKRLRCAIAMPQSCPQREEVHIRLNVLRESIRRNSNKACNRQIR